MAELCTETGLSARTVPDQLPTNRISPPPGANRLNPPQSGQSMGSWVTDGASVREVPRSLPRRIRLVRWQASRSTSRAIGTTGSSRIDSVVDPIAAASRYAELGPGTRVGTGSWVSGHVSVPGI
jgi:hypothetical protein